MKWDLGDNAEDGIRFLLVGAGSLLVLRLAYMGIVHIANGAEPDTLAAACAPFRYGYWATDPHVVVAHDDGLGARLALALTVSMATATVLALVVYLIVRMIRSAALPWAVGTLRTVLLLLGGWFLYAALLHPPAYVRFEKDALVVHQQAHLFGALSLPWGNTEIRHGRAQITGFSTRTEARATPVLVTITGQGEMMLTNGTATEAKALATQLVLWKAAERTRR